MDHGIADSCIDVPRRPRTKGPRGPYHRRSECIPY